MTQQKSIVMICYNNKRTNKDCLEGLTKEESTEFRRIVLKQFQKGIKIKISYTITSLKKVSAVNVSGKNLK